MIDIATQLANLIDDLIVRRIKQNEGDWQQRDGDLDPHTELVKLLRAALCGRGCA
jgi:hypothetical protein